MINFDISKYCYGCFACIDVCPKNCISIKKRRNGFFYPKFDVNNCIKCGKCEKVCPHLVSHQKEISKDNSPQILYSAKNRNEAIRLKGSSGSVFYSLSKWIIEKEQGIVVAACFDDKLKLIHDATDNMSLIERFMKSKYLQSNTTGIFNKVRNIIKNNKKVLFVGTPCQCQAMYNFLTPNQRNNIFLVDFVCHGVPSQDLFDKCIKLLEKRTNYKVVDVSFREKNKDQIRSYSISYKNSQNEILKQHGAPYEWAYYNGFLDHTTFRPSCFHCKYKTLSRCSDITLGDFWGIDKINTNIQDFNEGYSMVIVNSSKGDNALNSIKKELVLERIPLENAVKFNFALTKLDDQSNISKCFLLFNSILPIALVNNLFLTAKPAIFWRILRKILKII